jgi:hypothetical protein
VYNVASCELKNIKILVGGIPYLLGPIIFRIALSPLSVCLCMTPRSQHKKIKEQLETSLARNADSTIELEGSCFFFIFIQ